MHTGYAFLAALAVMAISLIGVIFARGALGGWTQRHLPYLATFSGGVFFVIAASLGFEAIHDGGWVVGASAIALGIVLLEGIRFLFPPTHHHHGAHDHGHSALDGRQVLMSDAMHNIGDGILLAGAFATDLRIGIAATIGVLLHEAVQEISEYFVLRGAGYSNREALTRNAIVSSSILIGLAFATYLSAIPVVLTVLSGIAAGGFFAVVARDLIPHALRSARMRGDAYAHCAAAILGLALMLGVQAAFPHLHEEGSHDHAHEEHEHEEHDH